MQGLTLLEQYSLWIILGVSLLGLAYAYYLRSHVLLEPTGDGDMRKVWAAIEEGAKAYLSRQLKSILPLMVLLTFALFYSVYIVPPSKDALLRFPHLSPEDIRLYIGLARAFAFLLGAGFSLAVGQLGMRMAVQANVRVAEASRKGFPGALRIAYRAGTFTGMLTDGLGLLGGTVIFMVLGVAAPDALLGFGFGGTLIALFMRVGGGIYTKAADVGADLVGKIEAGIPEDDPRNPAVIADLVGDNVGDCAGMAADIFESYEVTIVSGLILGLALYQLTGRMEWVVFPLMVRAVGVMSSILGTYLVKASPSDKGNAMIPILRGFLISAVNSVFFFGLIGYFYLQSVPFGWWRPVLATALGVALAVGLFFLTSYFTEVERGPVNEIKDATHTGAATTIITGLSVGFESTFWAIILIAVTLMVSVAIFGTIPGMLAAERLTYILYGVALTGIGMLTLTGDNVAMDSFGPISDNASGIGEMAWGDRKDKVTVEARKVLTGLDQAGNSTKAVTKGVAIGSAVIAAVALFGSFIVNVSAVQEMMKVPLSEQLVSIGIRVSNPQVLIGMLIGGGLPWLFSAFALKAVGRAAALIVDEVRKQFKAGVLTRKVKPNYHHVVTICTYAAQHELISMALLGVLTPILVGLLLQVEALGGFLAGVILSGQLLAVFMSNAGGAWDNAKKAIEDEARNPARNTGKGSDRHKASVVGDTVGDPLKDTAGPALNPMIKVVNLISVIIAPIVVQYPTLGMVGWSIVVLLVAALIWSYRQSKKPVSARLGKEAESY